MTEVATVISALNLCHNTKFGISDKSFLSHEQKNYSSFMFKLNNMKRKKTI